VPNQKNEERTYKDDVYSLGLVILEMTLSGGEITQQTLIDVHNLNKDSTSEKLHSVLNLLKERGYSNEFLKILEQSL
jgi:hypothetical protein